MLYVITGPLYSDLENALADHLQSFRSHSPIAPLTIVVPSDSLRLRLQWALCAERDLSLFNVHLLTFFQLALRVVEEQGPPVTRAFRSDSFFREWIHHLLQRRKSLVPDLARLTDMPGAWAALWSTIKDLKDGSVDPVFARESLKHTVHEHDPVCQSVLKLYDWYRQEQHQRQAVDCDDVARIASASVGSSTFLSQQAHIWYYGFYDLTQVQLDLFHAIAQTYSTTVYFPVVRDHPAYHFAQQFFDRHLLGLSVGRIQSLSGSGERSPLRALFTKNDSGIQNTPLSSKESDQEKSLPACQIIHVSGADEEMTVVAKEILRYAEERHVPWHEIGVVGRTLSGYERLLPRVFREHGIPFNTTMQRSIVEFPFVQALLRLLMLAVSDFQRDHVMDILTSPFFRWVARGPDGESPRPDLWDRASRRLGITKGREEWTRFIRVLEKEGGKDEGRQKAKNPDTISHKQITVCGETLRMLFDVVIRVPPRASYDVFVDHALKLLEEFLVPSHPKPDRKLPTFNIWNEFDSSDHGYTHDPVISQAVYDQFAEIRMLSQISDEVSFSEFVETVERFMQDAMVPLNPTTEIIDGVWALDAMAARGFSFRVLFIVGVNEHVFPRHIREDAFLRDPVRRFFDVNLGFKMSEKAAAYEEEQLLFYLLINSANEAVTLLTQGSSQQNRSSIPSWYVGEVQRCVGDLPMTVVPKRGSEKRRVLPQYADTWLTPQETRVQWLLDRRLPRGPFNRDVLGRDALGWSVVQGGIAALACHESSSPRLNRFDGLTGGLSESWEDMQRRGMSPTALEYYALCPFKFFAKHILKLEAVGLPELGSGIGPREAGNLLHSVLRECVGVFVGQEVFRHSRESARAGVAGIVKHETDRVFRNYEQWAPTGYPLLWELQQDQLTGVATQVILQDLFDGDDTWMPVGFEEAVSGEMTVVLGHEQYEIPLVGRIDRVDWSASQQQSRIIDYKYKMSARSIPSSQSLARDVVRGKQLQPPLYLILAEGGNLSVSRMTKRTSDNTPSCAGVWLYFITPQASESAGSLTRVAFTQEMWKLLKPQFETTMNVVLGGIHRGEYFIVPGNHCEVCDYHAICHRTHPMSRWRANADRVQTQGHRDVRNCGLAKK
jgi:ATP-dependent helicase/nuclease subunit B